ncbi:MAG: S41 family peptidase [Candidatus Promineifilaceae bacterium]
MSETVRNILITTLLAAIAGCAFFLGYLANDFIEEREMRRSVEADQFALFFEAWDKIGDNFIGDLPESEQLTYAAIRGSLYTLNDPYTVFLEPVVREDEREALRGNFGGIGVSLSRDDDGNTVLSPTPENPAAEAGVLIGDILLAVDGELVSAETPLNEIGEKLRGEKGSDVELLILRTDTDEQLEFEVTRADILIPSVVSRILREDSRIGYIKLSRFTGESGGEINAALESLIEQGAGRFILDLRDNGGGLLNAAVEVSDNFLDRQIVYHQITRADGESSESTERETVLPDSPLIVLINGGTASSSEIVAGALQDHNRGVLIGERTFGKGSVQLVYDLSNGSSVHVTWARWFTPNRQQIDQNGLTPDVEVVPTQAGRDLGRDEQLEHAIGLLK